MTQVSIARIETGVNLSPNCRTLDQLACALGVDLMEFWEPSSVWAQEEMTGPPLAVVIEPENTEAD